MIGIFNQYPRKIQKGTDDMTVSSEEPFHYQPESSSNPRQFLNIIPI